MTAAESLPRFDLQNLLAHRAPWCVSIFMGTHRGGAELNQDPIRLKNLLKEAESRLIQAGMRRSKVADLLGAVSRRIDDTEFWRSQGEGLAIFVAPAFQHEFRSPLPFPEHVVVADRFEIKPLLPVLADNGHFFVLALSQKHNRLLLATRYTARRVPTPNAPPSLADALRYDDPERHLQFRSRAPVPSTGGRRPAMFHGHGAGVDDMKTNVLRYCQMVDRGLHDVLREERAPLVLAAVEFEQAIYRDANTYLHLVPEGVHGNPDGVADQDLARDAWQLVEPRFRAEREAAAEQFRVLRTNGRGSSELETVLPAAWQGRVDTLFAPRGVHVWGRFTPETMELRRGTSGPAAGEYDLLDEAARYTLSTGGKVYVVDPAEMPDGETVAAVFRY